VEGYRAYTVGSDGRFISYEPMVCMNDAEATERAKRLVDDHDIELWSGVRVVIRLSHKSEQAASVGGNDTLRSSRPGPDRQISGSALRLAAMPAIDEWTEKLRCPKCVKEGMASLSQSDDDMPTVQSVPDGFKVVATMYGPDFQCTTCNVAVVP
jgi:hypothetical protein